MTELKKSAREELAESRKSEILHVAIQLFSERGFAAADTQELANRVGVGKGTIYRYFTNKQELFFAAADRAMDDLKEFVDSQTDFQSDPMEQITQGIYLYLTFFSQHKDYVELLIQERAYFRDRKKPTYFVHRDKNMSRWFVLIVELIDQKRIRDLPAHQIIDTISNLVYGTMFTNHFVGIPKSIEDQTNQILEIIFLGLLNEPKLPKELQIHPHRNKHL